MAPNDLLAISQRSGLPFMLVAEAAELLVGGNCWERHRSSPLYAGRGSR